MEHRREFKEEMEIVNESKDEESPEVQRSFLSDPSPQTRDVSLRGRGGEMAPPISASLGAMRPLVWKLDMLLLAPPPGCSSEIVKHKMKLLTEDVEEISYCLDTLSQLEDPPETAKCWMNEVRDLSYNMEDYIDSLNVRDPDHSLVADDIKITSPHRKWFPHVRTPKKHTLDEQIVGSVSEFRIYVGDAMKRHKMYGVKYFSTLRHTLVSVDHMLPTPTSYEETLEIVIDSRMNEFINSLANDGADQLQLKVVPILGSACLGKTTLATVLYNRIGLQFDCRAFIRVSKNNDMKKNFQDMLSQLERQQCPPQYSKEGDLINEIRNYLQDKRYLIIVDDVWSASVWDMIIRAFPKGSHGSRVITTTQIEDVAFRCCRYQPEQIFEMKPLDDRHSRKLFFNTLFGSESNCPEQFNKVSNEIIAICGGLPLATISIASLLASQPVITEDLLKHICESLSSLFSANPISERTRQALNLSFNNLPQYLKTCLLYVSMYQEGYTFCKNDLVKQWTAEGFIDATNGEDVEEVAESYLHQLISRRFIQPMRIDYNNEVLSCAVHDVVHDLITHKSAEENFIVAIDYSEKNVVLSHKARRLSILFGDARYAKAPAHIVESRARSLTFWGLFECMPRITEFKLLRVVNLQLSGYGGSKGPVRYNNPLDLSVISELSRMRYLKIVSHHCVKLPDYKGGLHCLETLDIMDAVVLKFGIGVYLPHLLHLYLSLRDDRSVQNWIDEMSDLDNLKHLQDLRLTFSSARSLSQEENMLVLWGFISRHNNLKTIVVACDSSDKVTGGASDTIISWDNMAPPPLLQRFEFSSHSSVIFSRIPKWVGKLGNLRILKISVRILEMDSVDILRGLHTLTSLSLSVSRETSKRIIFHKKAGFSVLRYIKLRFTTGISWIKFEENAMPNLLKLKLVFNAIPQIDHYEHGIITIDHMPALKEISVKFGAANQEYALRTLVRNHSRNPTINMPSPVEYSSYSNQSTKLKEQQDEIMEEEPDEYYKQQPDKIVEVEPDGSYKQPDKIVEKEQDGCTKTLERPAHERISNSSEPYSSVHVQAGAAVQRSVKHDPSETTWSCSRAIYLVEDVHSSPDEGSISNMVPASAPPAYVIRISGDYGLEQETRHPREYDPGWNEAYSFSLDELMSGTSNFSRENLLRDFSVANYLGKRSISVYKGYVHGDRIVAVKYPYTSSMKDYQAWQMGVDNYSRIYHPHLVQLIGFCSQYPHRILVYEYVPNGSLKHHLFKKHLASLAWLTRLKIAIGAAKGLSFLHDDADERMTFYRGFKASNILLDSDYEAKLWGLSLVKDSPQYDDTHRLAGEAAREQKDVYNFGVVLMQLMSGKQSVDTKRLYWKEDDVECSSSNPYSNSNPDSDRNSNSNPDMTCGPIPVVFPNLNSNTNPDCSEISNWNSTSKTVSKWSTDPRYSQKVKDKLHNIMDPRLEGQYSVSAARSALKIARRCLESMPEQRPPMRQVLDALEPLLSNDITDGQLLASGKPETMKTKLTQYFTSSKDKELAGGAVEVEQAREGEDEMFRSNRLTVVEENFDGSSVTVIRRVQDMDYQQQSAGNKAKWSRYLVGSKAKVAKRLSLKGRAKAERNNDWPRRGKKQQGELVVGGQQV